MGAKEAGGRTVGILRTYNRHDANQYVDVVIPSGLGDGRNVLVATAGEAATVQVQAVDAYGNLYGAEVGPRTVRKYEAR